MALHRVMGGTMMFCAVLLVLAVGRLIAQGGAAGTILGTVTDATGATVAGAKVQVTNVDTGVDVVATTTSGGEYSVPYLHPGVHKVTVRAPGFQTSVTDKIKLAVDQHARVDAALKAGQITEVVEVTATNVSLDTDTAEISQTINSRQVVDLPLNNRNFVGLLFLSSGTVMTGGEAGNNTLSAVLSF